MRRARPDVFLHHFVHIPWTQSDAWRVLPRSIREELYCGLLANDIIGFHTSSYRRNFLQCCRDLMDLEVDFEAGVVHFEDREVWVRNYPLPIDAKALFRRAPRPTAWREQEEELLRRRRDHLILRVDRADLSKNVLRGFSSFDLFLEQHPEFRERVTFIAQLMPSRTDVPEYAEYLERIEALVAVVNHRHGTPDWMPIQLKLRDDLEEAVAAYKHYDVLLVNAMFDGMNLVAKEGPMVNERDGVSILSENTGAHEELGEYALSVNPFDIQALADSIHAALTMAPGGARAAPARAEGDRHGPRPGRLDRRAARDIREKAAQTAAEDVVGAPRSRECRTPAAAGSARGAAACRRRPVACARRSAGAAALGPRRRGPRRCRARVRGAPARVAARGARRAAAVAAAAPRALRRRSARRAASRRPAPAAAGARLPRRPAAVLRRLARRAASGAPLRRRSPPARPAPRRAPGSARRRGGPAAATRRPRARARRAPRAGRRCPSGSCATRRRGPSRLLGGRRRALRPLLSSAAAVHGRRTSHGCT